jgi:hypothetical protein
MDIIKLQKIRMHLDNVPAADEDTCCQQHCFDLVEERAIAILDSQHSDFTPGLLQEYLMSYLHLRQLEYGLIAFPESREA